MKIDDVHGIAEDIVRVVTPFMSSVGRSVFLGAGSDGGGDVLASETDIQGGTGATKGGDVTIKAGNGGPNGKGGNLTIIGGVIKGGDATGA